MKYKFKWKKLITELFTVPLFWWLLKVIFMIVYNFSGKCETIAYVLGYSKDSGYCYLINKVKESEKFDEIWGWFIVVDIVAIIIVTYILYRLNRGKKLLIIEHSGLNHIAFSYNKEELEPYCEKKLSLNHYENMNNAAISVEEKAKLLIEDVVLFTKKLDKFIKKNYQLAYAGAPVGCIPCIFLLGYKLDDANKKVLFHKFRNHSTMDDEFHLLPERESAMQMTMNPKRKEHAKELLVLVQFTMQISDVNLEGVRNDKDTVFKYHFGNNINYDIIDSAKQIDDYANTIYTDIENEVKSSKINRVKLCIAASSDFIFALGTKFSKTQNIDTVIYQFVQGRYTWGINVTDDTVVLNECED